MKRLDRTPRSGSNDELVGAIVTELLLNGPSSFAAIYGFVARTIKMRPDVTWLLTLLKKMEKTQQIQIAIMNTDGSTRDASGRALILAKQEYQKWLSNLSQAQLSAEALSVDEVGLWCALTDVGRQQVVKTQETDWTVDVFEQEHLIRIRAETEEEAERVLHNWLERESALKVIRSTRTVSRDPQSLVEVTWRFRRK